MGVAEMEGEEVRKMVDLLVGSVPRRTRGQANGQLMLELAERAREKGAVGEAAGMTAKELKHKINEKAAKDGSGWIHEKWPAALTLFAESVEPSLVAQSRAAGLPRYVRPTKSPGSGNSMSYHLEAVDLPEAMAEHLEEYGRAEAEDYAGEAVPYVLDMAPKLNCFGQWVFGKGRRLTLRLRLALALPLLALFMLSLLWAFGLGVWMLRVKAPISVSDLSLVGMVAFIVYFFYRLIDDLSSLLTLKYQVAPWWATSFKEGSVLLEMDEIDREAGSAYARLKRYTSTCPICDGQVLLDDGKMQFGRRVVSKCHESPDEHVFSFDPKTRLGYPLRQRRDGYVGL